MSGTESYQPVEMRADIYELADAAFDVAEAEAWLNDQRSAEFSMEAENDIAAALIRLERAKAGLVRWTDTWKRWQAIEESLWHGVPRRWVIDSVIYDPKTLEMH